MTLIKQEFQKHIKKINNNDFIYKHKIAFYLLSEMQFKLYEEGFRKGFELAQQKMSDHVSEIKETHIVPRQMERKIIGYQFRKPKKAEIIKRDKRTEPIKKFEKYLDWFSSSSRLGINPASPNESFEKIY